MLWPSHYLTTLLWTRAPAAMPVLSFDHRAGTQKEISGCSGSPLKRQSVFRDGGRRAASQNSHDTAREIYNRQYYTGAAGVAQDSWCSNTAADLNRPRFLHRSQAMVRPCCWQERKGKRYTEETWTDYWLWRPLLCPKTSSRSVLLCVCAVMRQKAGIYGEISCVAEQKNNLTTV